MVRLFQAADAIDLSQLTRHQLREWTGSGRRALLRPDVEPAGPGRHALYAWQTLLVLRLLGTLQREFAVEVGAWAPAARALREELADVMLGSLWRSSVVFRSMHTAEIASEFPEVSEQAIWMPLANHLDVFAERMSLPRPNQLPLFAPMAVSR